MSKIYNMYEKKGFFMNKSIRNTVLLIGVFLLVTGSLFAQAELRFDTWVSGNLRYSGEDQQYMIRPTQGGRLVVETNANIDTYVTVYDAYFNQIGYDDDSGGNYNARLEMFVAAGQTYHIVVSGFSAGTYQVRASVSTIQTTELRLNTWVSGTTRENVSNWYSVRTTQAGLLVVETSGNTDTVLKVYDASYNYINSDDDSGEGSNARLELLVQSGSTYIIELSGYNYNSGPYQIRASQSPIQATELRLDTDVSANMREGESYWYRVRATQNGNLTVETNGSIDTYIELYDDSYNLLGYDDDSGNGNNARLTILAVNGNSYLFRVRAYSNSSSGPYRIWASHRNNAPIMAPNTIITELRFGTQVSGNLGGGDEYWYSVRATENGYITVGTTGNTDTYLEAYNSSYTPLGTDDDSGGNGQALLQIQVQAGQTYLFKLRGYNSSVTGPYIIWANFSRAAG
jgi:hypothetical protein